jgi:hypothetical protein
MRLLRDRAQPKLECAMCWGTAQSVAACEVDLRRELVGHVCCCICGEHQSHLWTVSYVPEIFRVLVFHSNLVAHTLRYTLLFFARLCQLLTEKRFKMELRLYRNKPSLSSLAFELTMNIINL